MHIDVGSTDGYVHARTFEHKHIYGYLHVCPFEHVPVMYMHCFPHIKYSNNSVYDYVCVRMSLMSCPAD